MYIVIECKKVSQQQQQIGVFAEKYQITIFSQLVMLPAYRKKEIPAPKRHVFTFDNCNHLDLK